jgi:ABC-type transport system involved in cytochrome c biogenesis ATPase subunit
MLERLLLRDVGPGPVLEFEFGPRINLITGDNGVGKSFVLDVAWWVLTRTWAGYPASPRRGNGAAPTISYAFRGKARSVGDTSRFDFPRQEWTGKQGRPANPGLVVYARVDGSFSVWDPARNYWRHAPTKGVEAPDRPPAFHFDQRQVWDGLRDGERHLCNGLILDWVAWQREDGTAFNQLRQVLKALAASDDEPLMPGKTTRVSLADVRDMPTLALPYGDVPLVYAAAGMRRIVALAYLLVWTWQEHQRAAELLNEPPTNEITFLVDEIEAHLHPRWQRAILPALVQVMQAMTQSEGARVQVIAATHAPLLLASVEAMFDEEQDRVFTFELRGSAMAVRQVAWAKQGDVVNWLVSDVFGLKQARSRDAERAIEAAEALMRNDKGALPPGLTTRGAIHAELLRVLAGHDPFWPRWVVG